MQYSMLLLGVIGFMFLPALVIWHARTHSYICKNCGVQFSISALKDFVSPHRYLKCPKCGKWAWQKEIRNTKNQ